MIGAMIIFRREDSSFVINMMDMEKFAIVSELRELIYMEAEL